MAWLGTKTFTEEDYYNFSELNRVITNTAYLNDVLGTNISQLSLTYTSSSIPNIAELNNIEGNLELIANKFYVPGDWISSKKWERGDNFDFNDANRLESNIKALYELYETRNNSYLYCGELICGGAIYVQ